MRLLFKPRDKKYIGKGSLPNGTFENTNSWLPITNYLEKGAEEYPDKNMFRMANSDGKIVDSYTYSSTNKRANQIANGLIKDFNIKKGDKVGMYMLNCSEYVLSIIAIHKTGGVQVPVNKDEKGDRLAYIINHSEMKALIIDRKSLPFINEIVDQLKFLETVFITSHDVPEKVGNIKARPYSTFDNYETFNPGVDVTVADMERCMFTSGTTGMPKGVIRNHGGIIMTVRSFIQQQGLRNEDVLMSVLSLGHANAQVLCLFSAVAVGCSAVFYPRFSASSFWKWASESRATCVNMLGAIAEYVWAAPESKWDKNHNIRFVLAAPAPKNLKDFEKRFNTRVNEGYGSTEMGMVLWKDPEDDRPGSAGFQMEGYYLELRNPENTQEVIRYFWDPDEKPNPPEDAKGLLFIKPLVPHTTLNEYFKDEKRTQEAFDDEGFFNSDDLFAVGLDGRYYFQGRYSRIRVSGENVDPVSVAEVAEEYDSITQAVAVGIRLPDVSDDEIKLNIILETGKDFDPVEFCRWMAEKVTVAMVPRFIEIYKLFPLTSTQKISVFELKKISENTWDRNKTDLKFGSRK